MAASTFSLLLVVLLALLDRLMIAQLHGSCCFVVDESAGEARGQMGWWLADSPGSD